VLAGRAVRVLEGAGHWLTAAAGAGSAEAGARRFALTVGRSVALALLARQAQWALDTAGDALPRAAAARFAAHGIDLLAGSTGKGPAWADPAAATALAIDRAEALGSSAPPPSEEEAVAVETEG
jgi:hypothetical protein